MPHKPIMRIPLLSGVVADSSAEYLTALPVNLEVVATDNRIAAAQFRAPAGAVPHLIGPGTDRGGFDYGGRHIRVMGTRLVEVSTGIRDLGEVGGTGPVTFAEGFGRLAIRSSTSLFYLIDTTLTQVTDPDLGPVQDIIWVDGYFMTTDGTSIVVTELNDPTRVEPLKYGSAEEDPDMVTGLMKVANEAHAVGRYTIQVFGNVGGNGFPFSRIKGATIPQGCVGPHAKCFYADSFAFVGGGRGEAIGVYVAGQGSATRISPRVIDDELAKVADPAQIVLESRTYRAERRLLVHLPDRTLVFLANVSKTLEQPAWYVAQSGRGDSYRLRNATLIGSRWFVGDTESNSLGILDEGVSTHFGEKAEWQFTAGLLYNEARGAIINTLELIGLPGRAPAGEEPIAFLSMTRDGQTWSEERPCSLGKRGQREARMQWRPRARFANQLALRFRGYNDAMPGFAALEAAITPLAV